MPIDFVADEEKIDFQPEEPEFQGGLVGPKERRFSMYDVPALVDKLSESPLPTYGMDVPTESVPVALAKTVAGLGKGVVSPLGAAATAAAPIEAAAPALRAGFGALGTKGVYDIALEQITRPEARPKTIPEAVELAGKVVPQLAMAAAPLVHPALLEVPKEFRRPVEPFNPIPEDPKAIGKLEREFQLLRENWLPTIKPWRRALLDQEVAEGQGGRNIETNFLDSPGARDVERAKRYYELARKLYGREPQEVVTAATYTNPETGETTTGPNHPVAAEAQGVKAPEAREARETPEYGFQVEQPTGKTEVVSRDTAEQVARESGQLKEEPKGEKVHSDEILSPTEPGKTISEQTLTDEQLWQKAQRKEKLTPEEAKRLEDIEARGDEMGEAETTALQAEADALKSPPAEVEKAKGGEPKFGLKEGELVPYAKTPTDEMFAAPMWTEKYKGLTQAIRDLRQRARNDPVAGIRIPKLSVFEQQDLLNHGFTFTVDRQGNPLLKISQAAQADTLRRIVTERAAFRKQAEEPPSPPVAKSTEAPPTLTPAESTRLKSLTDKLESGKPLTSAEQKRYRALSDKVGGVAPEEKAAVKAEIEVQKVAATEGQRPAKEIKSELVSRLEKAIEAAPNEADVGERFSPPRPDRRTKLTIDIPGDGVFTIWNTKEALQTVLERARRVSTKPTEPVKVYREGISKADREWIEQQLKAQPPTTPPSTGEGMAGPGSPSITQPPDPKAQIQQLTDAFRNIEGRKVSTQEKLADAFKLGERLSGVKDRLSQSISGLKTAGNYLIGKWKQVQNIDDLLRAKGELSASKETRGWQVRKWVQQAKQATPSIRDQAAISKYIEAGGDPAQLRRGMAETKPRFKQAYQDALNLSPDLKVAAQNISNYFDSRLQEAIDAGVLKEGIEDYIHRIYESKPALGKQAFARVQDGILQRNPGLTKKRLFESDWEAEKAGFIPVQSYIDRIADYESSLSRAIAAREFIKKATEMTASDGRPIVDIKGVGVPIDSPEGVREATLIKPKYDPAYANTPGTPKFRGDYVDREYPALSRWKWVAQDSDGKPIFVQGDVAIHPDYVKRIDALLEPSRVRYGRYGSVARPALAASSAVKQTMLDLSGFHQVQVTVHGMEHRVMPWQIVKDIDFQNPNVEGLLKGGITLGGDYRLQREGLVGSSLSRHIPLLGPVLESYHNWLFQDYIPRLKMTMALHALERNKARYAGLKTPEEIYNLTASEANSAFGEQNYIMLERSKTAQDMARLILLAPDFLEARGRFAGQALSRGGKAFGNEQRTALLLGALTMWVTARLMNKALDGQPHNEPENLFSVVYKGKAYGLRTVQGDILHLLEKPMQFWMHRLNPVFSRTAMEAITGRDEFGRKRSFTQQVWDGVSTMMPIALRSSREKSLWESLANSFGITARRWSDVDDAFTLAKQWKKKHGITEPGEFIYDRDKDPLRGLKIALSQSDEAAATKEIKKLLESKQTTFPKLQQHFVRYARMPFTGSMGNDVKWKKTLTADQAKTVEAAMEHKRDMLKLFYQAARKYNESKNTPP